MEANRLHTLVTLFSLGILFVIGAPFVFAYTDDSTTTNEEVGALKDSINEKKQSVEQIQRQIKEYEKKISAKQAERASLSLELELLENRIAQTALQIEETETEMDVVNSELRLVQLEISKLEDKLDHDRELITGVLQEMQKQDHSLPLQVFFGTDSFSALFDSVDQLETISEDLQQAVERAKAARASLQEKKESQLTKLDQLEQLQRGLQKQKNELDASVGAQETLLTQTKQSEVAFQALLRELKQEQQYIDQQIAALQSEIEGKLSISDKVGEGGLLSWPFTPKKGISTLFHDPTYPFRHLFEHSGLDLPAPTGTPVKAVASGYIAWARTGRLYGNYVMIIHTNGIATLYAHLSRIDVDTDAFVGRGEVIGAVGSTGLSTGPHLHFEVRKNGIPTNPLNYLIPQ